MNLIQKISNGLNSVAFIVTIIKAVVVGFEAFQAELNKQVQPEVQTTKKEEE